MSIKNALLSFLTGALISLSGSAAEDNLPLVKVIATGGTIAHISNEPVPEARISGEALVKSIPELRRYARIEAEEFSRIGSGDFTTKMLVDLANRVNKTFSTEDQVAGVVVTIGSNSMEEVAYFLDLTVKSERPVVLTAAQRLHGSLGADGDKNLVDAVRVATSPKAKGMGALVVTDDQIHAARDVRKTISHRVEAWNSGDFGALGLVDSDRVTFYRAPLRKHTSRAEFDTSKLADLPKVDILYSYVGADGKLIRHAVDEDKARGIVLAAFPTGTGAPDQVRVAEQVAREGIIVVTSHRGGRGRPGPARAGMVDGDNLTPQHAHILLMLALTKTMDRAQIQRMFEEY